MRLSSGYVRVSGYADKIRRTLFAQVRDQIKSGVLDSRQVAYRAAQLNRLLFEVLVDTLGLRKGDVVRVMIDYEVADGDIKFNWDTLTIEVYPLNESLTTQATEEARRLARTGLIEREFEFEEEQAEPPERRFKVLLDGEEVGRLVVLDVGDSYAVSGEVTVGDRKYRVGRIIGKEENLEQALRRVVNMAVLGLKG